MVIFYLGTTLQQRFEPVKIILAAAADDPHEVILLVVFISEESVAVVLDLVDFELLLNLLLGLALPHLINLYVNIP